MPFLFLIKRELTLLVQKRKLILFILLFGASAYALLIGNLYRHQVPDPIPLVLCDEDHTALSRSLTQYMHEADRVDIIASTDSEKEAYSFLDSKKVEGMVIIPQDFSKKISRHEPVSILFLTDGTNTLYQSYALSPVQNAAAQFSAEREMESAALDHVPYLPAAPIYVSFRIRENPTSGYGLFYLYGVMITAAQLGLMISFAESLHEDLKAHFFQKGPVMKLLLAKELPLACLSLLATTPSIAIVLGIFHLPFKGSILLFFLLYAAYAGAALFMAALMTLFFKTEIALVQCLVFYALPAFLLAGYIWPNIAMLPLMRWISYLIPLHYIIIDFRNLALTGTSGTYLFHFLILLGVSILGFFITAGIIQRRINKETHRPVNTREIIEG
ncbi:ABC transporter permease [uncultured Dialister sp.]|uniref:ABC transporter permease n=1 Tax=uncultured Dialister sp. TaxID=278064 RepID=UPI002586DF80|nr:ABC transporter permease [uncultured Dialister sp.]